MKEIKHEVVTNGIPNLKNIPKEMFHVFCVLLLGIIEEYYKKSDKEERRQAS